MAAGIGNQLAREMIAKFPKSSTLQIARMLKKENKAVFLTVETARTMVRRIRGAQGEHSRKATKEPMTRDAKHVEACKKWGAMLPPSDQNSWKRIQLPPEPKRWLIASDLHVPYHSVPDIEAMLRYCEGRVDGVIINGDGIDCHAVSSFSKDPRARRFASEIEMYGKVLDTFAELKPKRFLWKGGNHEYRYERYLAARAPELFDMPWASWEKMLDLERRKIQWVDYMDPIERGKLTILHGHEMTRGFTSPVNPARGAFLRGHACCIIGHYHRTSDHTETNIQGVMTSTWSAGCLCDRRPRYAPFNSWNAGFAILDLTGETWAIENKRIIDGRVM